jgi:hypothetical protein
MSEGKKYDSGKAKMHLLPPKALLEVAKVLTFGADKYGEENWRDVADAQNRYASASLRHLFPSGQRRVRRRNKLFTSSTRNLLLDV